MNSVRKTTIFAVLATMAACGDNTVAPTQQDAGVPNVQGQGVQASLTPTDTIRFSMTINPYSPTYVSLGAGNSITFPAKSVCNPATTKYGNGEWDKSCVAATVPVTVNVKAWLDKQGHPGIDFSPNIRFVPSALPTNWVQLTFADYAASLDPMYAVLYCKEIKEAAKNDCKDESKDDATLATRRNPLTGQITRRVKHFSGYMVGAGDDGRGSGGEMNITTPGAVSFAAAPPPPPKYAAVKTTIKIPKITASADIGPEGGVLQMSQTGLTVVVPPLAVLKKTHFTVTTLSNGMLGYDFQPHGTKFLAPLVATQSLDFSAAVLDYINPIQVAYFADDTQIDLLGGTVLVNELLNIFPDRSHNEVKFLIWHFSGYMFVSGRGGF